MIALSKTLLWQETSVIAEPEGQLLIVQGFMVGRKWTLIGVYVPHVGKTEYFKLLIKKIEKYGDGNSVIMGDFNDVMNARLDKSRPGMFQSVIPDICRTWLHEKGFIDACRNWHQDE